MCPHSNHSNKAICAGSFSRFLNCQFFWFFDSPLSLTLQCQINPAWKYKKTSHKPCHIRLRLMQLAKAALSDLLQNLRVGTGLTQCSAEHWPAKAPSRTALRPGGKSSVKTSQNAGVCNSRCSGCRCRCCCCWHAIKFHFSPLHNCRVWQCLKLIMWFLLLPLLLFVWCAFGKLPWKAADFTSETLAACLINHAQAESAKVSRDLSKRRPLRGPQHR